MASGPAVWQLAARSADSCHVHCVDPADLCCLGERHHSHARHRKLIAPGCGVGCHSDADKAARVQADLQAPQAQQSAGVLDEAVVAALQHTAMQHAAEASAMALLHSAAWCGGTARCRLQELARALWPSVAQHSQVIGSN